MKSVVSDAELHCATSMYLTPGVMNAGSAALRFMCAACPNDSLLPIVVFAHMRTRKTVAKLTPEEKTYLLGLPDNFLSKVPAWSAHYPGAWGMITTNLNVPCGLGQGTRGREVGLARIPA